ncbi:MAG TPA: endolytic transglycosylase MltG, partial [Rhizomicrobium sp.]|nr:endolytic transglycosylase MltG [Rhizomicrobium sp.]
MRRFFLFVLFLAALVAAGFFAERYDFTRPGPAAHSGNETVVLIKQGEGLSAISHQLADAGTIANANLFLAGVRLRNQQATLKAGEYAIPSMASMADVMGILQSGKSIQHKITAAEGLTSQMIYDILKADPVLTGDVGAVPAEGTLLPETYLFTRGMTRAQMLAQMHDAQKKFIAANWGARAKDLPFQTEEQALTLASIVEKETALAEERRHIASVFANRLRMGMKLQSDPTIIYGITKGYPLGRRIRESEILATTPYNTYA